MKINSFCLKLIGLQQMAELLGHFILFFMALFSDAKTELPRHGMKSERKNETESYSSERQSQAQI